MRGRERGQKTDRERDRRRETEREEEERERERERERGLHGVGAQKQRFIHQSKMARGNRVHHPEQIPVRRMK